MLAVSILSAADLSKPSIDRQRCTLDYREHSNQAVRSVRCLTGSRVASLHAGTPGLREFKACDLPIGHALWFDHGSLDQRKRN